MACADPLRPQASAFAPQGDHGSIYGGSPLKTSMFGGPDLERQMRTLPPGEVGQPPPMIAPPSASFGGQGQQGQQGHHHHHGVELHDRGWFHAESNRDEQEMLAALHMETIQRAVDERHMKGLCPDARWVNDPDAFPDLGLRGSMTSNGVIPFPPHDQQYYVRGSFDPLTSRLRETAVPSHVVDEFGQSAWVRLVDFADHADACHLFDESSPHATHFGRIRQGALDTGYLTEAMQAVALRPKLARRLFYCWDVRRSVYIARIYKHGTWMRVELDDFVPVGATSRDAADGNVPICCRSEYFPYVLWPSLVEKAYAKVHTIRGSSNAVTEEDTGGWEAISGGGRVEQALADLTGGVAGRWHTCDVSVDRLFLYFYELQRDTLFVCRPHETNCERHGVRLNPYYAHVVNRACVFEGKPYIQVFSAASGVYDGGLQDITVPFSLLHSEEYPETSAEGFFWVTATDFHEYFDTIFECRLVNCGDVSIPGMPPPRIPPPISPRTSAATSPRAAVGKRHQAGWFEWVFANPGEVSADNAPEFTVMVPEHSAPCDVIVSVEQLDSRMLMRSCIHTNPVPVLVKVYEHIEGRRYYSSELVCKSNWLPVRDSMVAFTVLKGGEFKLVVEFPDLYVKVDRMIFRCYTSRPQCMVTAAAALAKHYLVDPTGPPKAQRATLVGSVRPDRLDTVYAPQALDDEHDCLRKPEFDIAPGWKDLQNEFQQDCSIM